MVVAGSAVAVAGYVVPAEVVAARGRVAVKGRVAGMEEMAAVAQAPAPHRS